MKPSLAPECTRKGLRGRPGETTPEGILSLSGVSTLQLRDDLQYVAPQQKPACWTRSLSTMQGWTTSSAGLANRLPEANLEAIHSTVHSVPPRGAEVRSACQTSHGKQVDQGRFCGSDETYVNSDETYVDTDETYVNSDETIWPDLRGRFRHLPPPPSFFLASVFGPVKGG